MDGLVEEVVETRDTSQFKMYTRASQLDSLEMRSRNRRDISPSQVQGEDLILNFILNAMIILIPNKEVVSACFLLSVFSRL